MAELSMDNFTETVVKAMGPKTSPRVREVMTSLIRHMHDFAREVNLTTAEYLAACDFVVRIGQISDETRNEAILASDIFGLESLVDFLDHRRQHLAARQSLQRHGDMHLLKVPGFHFGAPAEMRRLRIWSCRAFKRG